MAGNSTFVVMTLSPVFHVNPLATKAIPSLVFLMKVTSSGLALINWAASCLTVSQC